MQTFKLNVVCLLLVSSLCQTLVQGSSPDWDAAEFDNFPSDHADIVKREATSFDAEDAEDLALQARKLTKRQTEIDIQGSRDRTGTHITGSAAHTFKHDNGDSTRIGGHAGYHSKVGVYGGGVEASHTFDHGRGRSTTIGGSADFGRGRRPNYGIGIRHTFRFKRSQDAALELEEREKRQTEIDIQGSRDRTGTHVTGSAAHTFKHDNGDNTRIGGHAGYHSKVGVYGGGVEASHTFDHGRGRSTTIGGGVDFGRGRRPSPSFGIRHTIRFKRNQDAALELKEREKRQTEIDIQGSRDRSGTHITGSAAHTFNHRNGDRTRVGGHAGYHSKVGVYGGGVEASHTFDHGRGRSTTIGGGVDFGRGRRPSPSFGIRHTIRFKRSQDAALELKKREKRQTEIDIQGSRDRSWTHIAGSAAHTFKHDNGDRTRIGGHAGYHSKVGVYGGGVEASHTFDHGRGRETTIGGGVDFERGRSPSSRFGIRHIIRFKRSQDAALELKERQKRQTDVNAHGSIGGSSGTDFEGSFSHTFDHGKRGSSTIEGSGAYSDRAGLGARLGGSRTFNHRNGDSSTIGGYADYHSREGVYGGGIRGSHTIDHGRGRSTTFGGNVDFSRGSRPDWGVGITHRIRFKRSPEENDVELNDREKRQANGTTLSGGWDFGSRSGSLGLTHTRNYASGRGFSATGTLGYDRTTGFNGRFSASGSHRWSRGRTNGGLTGNLEWDARNGFNGAGLNGFHTINHRRGGGSTRFTGGIGVDGNGAPTANAGVLIRF